MKSAKFSLIASVFVCCLLLSGCSDLNTIFNKADNLTHEVLPDKRPYVAHLADSYYQIDLRQSTSADVLTVIERPQYNELLSQSESVVASWGEKRRDRRLRQMWFNMAAFDEETLAVSRKHFFVIDERPKGFLMRRQLKMRFDTEMVFEKEFLEKPYANQNARRTEILRKVLEKFRDDIRQVREDNKHLASCGMLVNQTFEGILTKLDGVPQLASKLSDLAGLEFDHISMGKGRSRLVIGDDIVKVKIKIGSIVRRFHTQQDVIDM